MARMKRDKEFTQIRIQIEDKEFLDFRKRGHSEQTDVIVHRILGEYQEQKLRITELQYMVEGQKKVIQHDQSIKDDLKKELESLKQELKLEVLCRVG